MEDASIDNEPGLLCIGLDIAWFGGTARNPDSQYDCLAAVYLKRGIGQPRQLCSEFTRLQLHERDPEGRQLLETITSLLTKYDAGPQIIFALDAPVQATPRNHLPPRNALPAKGTLERRACENYLSSHRQRIDKDTGGSRGWQPNIQPGAPLAPRVIGLLEGLRQQGFSLWTQNNQHDNRLVLECFPAEAIWAMKRLGQYPGLITASQAKAYKKQQARILTAKEVTDLVHTVLDAFSTCSGSPLLWESLVEDVLHWMLADTSWQKLPGQYRGGKLLDDVVDTMICLATALSYAHGQAHVWQQPNHPKDGHIMGPGLFNALMQ